MNGAPAKPMSGIRPPSSRLIWRMASKVNASASRGSTTRTRVDVGGRSHRALDGRALALDEVEGDAHRLERQQQIGEQDRRVDVDAAHRLQRDFGREVGRAAELQKCVVLAERAIFRHVAAGLPHEPDGRRDRRIRAGTRAEIGSRAHRGAVIMRAILSSLFRLTPLAVARRFSGGQVSPILVRPVREQFEHDRVIRVLQARYKRKYEVAINPGAEQNASVGVGELAMFPDLVLFSPERGRKLQGTVEVETDRIGQHARSDGRVGTVQPPARRRSISTCRPTRSIPPAGCAPSIRSSPPRSGRITRPSIRCASRWCIDRSADGRPAPKARHEPAGEGRAASRSRRRKPARQARGEAGGRKPPAASRRRPASRRRRPPPRPRPGSRQAGRSPPPRRPRSRARARRPRRSAKRR